MLGIKLGGDPGSVRAVASWLRDSVAASADEVAGVSRWARDRLGEDLWWDAAAILAYMHFNAGMRAAGEYADKVRDLARRFDDSADKLEYAMGLMADAKEQARLGGLEHTDEYIKPPEPAHPPDSMEWSSDERLQAAHRDQLRAYPEQLRIYGEQRDAYGRCEELVEAAAQTILDQMDVLGRVIETDWSGLTFDAGAFVADETSVLMRWFQAKHIEGIDLHGRQGLGWTEQALQGRGDDLRQEELWRRASESAEKFNKHVSGYSRAGLAIKVLKPVGPLMTVAAIIYDVRSGHTARRAIFTAGVGGIGGAMGSAAIAFFMTNPPGWLLVFAGFIAGVLASQLAAPYIYEEYIMSSREKLLNSPGAPDIDPGAADLGED